MHVVLEDICIMTVQYRGLVLNLDNGSVSIGRNKSGQNTLIYNPYSIRRVTMWFTLKPQFKNCGSIEELKIKLDMLGRKDPLHCFQ